MQYLYKAKLKLASLFQMSTSGGPQFHTLNSWNLIQKEEKRASGSHLYYEKSRITETRINLNWKSGLSKYGQENV